jgi:hypothetical protein
MTNWTGNGATDQTEGPQQSLSYRGSVALTRRTRRPPHGDITQRHYEGLAPALAPSTDTDSYHVSQIKIASRIHQLAINA